MQNVNSVETDCDLHSVSGGGAYYESHSIINGGVPNYDLHNGSVGDGVDETDCVWVVGGRGKTRKVQRTSEAVLAG